MIEIIAQNLEDAKIIEACGADRIELVSDMALDGLSPKIETIERIVKVIKIPVNVMVRNHNNGFEYNENDQNHMLEFIKTLKDYPVNGIVIGGLKHGYLDENFLKIIIKNWQRPITYHRAIDHSQQVLSTYQSLISHRIDQILTSGGLGKAFDNTNMLDAMYKISNRHLLIGSGVGLNNIDYFKTRYPKANYHIGSDARIDQSFDHTINAVRLKKIIKIAHTI